MFALPWPPLLLAEVAHVLQVSLGLVSCLLGGGATPGPEQKQLITNPGESERNFQLKLSRLLQLFHNVVPTLNFVDPLLKCPAR